MPELLLLNPTELTRDPRARRQALAARQRGLDVVGLCGQISGAEPIPLDGVPVVRVGRERVAQALRGVGLGGHKRARPAMREVRGVWRLGRLARLTGGLVAAGRKLGPVRVVHANELETLLAGWLLARRSGARLVYDAHELYESSEPDYPQVYAAFTKRLEAAIARRAAVVTTVSEPIAEELERRLSLARRPTVVVNAPERAESEPEPRGDGPLRVVYQGAMGRSRPLEDLLDAAEAAEGVHLTIRVAHAPLDAIRDQVRGRGLEGRVSVLDPVPPTELVAALAPFDVGLVINRPLTRNDELVFPNKLFEYLMAGLAVVVPRLPGMTPLVEGERVGATYEPGRADDLGAVLSELARDPERLAELRRNAKRLALERYNAEAQAEVLARVWARG